MMDAFLFSADSFYLLGHAYVATEYTGGCEYPGWVVLDWEIARYVQPTQLNLSMVNHKTKKNKTPIVLEKI